jgi:hypothetical protein
MVLDSKTISNSLMSPGYPADWNTSNVQKIGLTDGNYRINQTKLENFGNIELTRARSIFDTRFNYYIQLRNQNGTTIPINGNLGIGTPANNTAKLVQITRVVIYNSSMIKLVIQLW